LLSCSLIGSSQQRLEHLERKSVPMELEPEWFHGTLITSWSIQSPDGRLFPLQEGDDVWLADADGQMRLTKVTYRLGANVAGIFVPGDFSTDGVPLRRGQRAANRGALSAPQLTTRGFS
jgi:hypothetical protein